MKLKCPVAGQFMPSSAEQWTKLSLHKMLRKSLLALGLLLAIGSSLAQSTTRLACNDTNSMAFDANQLAGIWYEVARNPAPKDPFLCVQVNFTVDANTLDIDTTYSNTPAYPWVNQTMTASIDIATPQPDGYNISYVNGLTNTSYTIFKLLETDYTNYAFICGYQNASDVDTYFGILLTRNQTPSAQDMLQYEDMAYANYTEFLNGTMPTITQSDTCWANSAFKLYSDTNICFTLLFVLIMQILGQRNAQF